MKTNEVKAKADEKVLEYVSGNPKTDARTVAKELNMKPIYGVEKLLKQLVKKGKLVSFEEEGAILYSKVDTVEKSEEVPSMVEEPGKDKAVSTGKRDFTKYTLIYSGERTEPLSKGRLAVAIVKAYVSKNKNVTVAKVKEVFPDEIVKNYCVVQPLAEAKKKSVASGRDRYFMDADSLITLKDKKVIVVTSQISVNEIKPIIAIARKLGMTIK